ncbi:Asp-tRNA(Asn)/Glu-tRNA(Gln) amidotransferase subunit GatA [Criblamydia sequanensis]|uniref:Glutamyl-tRNA(Gln) amidotransferase subunit A n=1 Tax=Candidatus Criblamydia sequanensis CRIB-18 TaxID=1437425 RepID=A0A090D1V8_9BACT|nr:Asp-tRNA(Asn)/Glu-tRNA(Gln) amidotransferase subunit GatA [Criblamydia sequanensis]CDR33803.1 Aspartyl/glutamyl-tRNA(Asn/Gln) amidotransferase subunit A [Criblamydia sequanensis CRIB-18]
MHTLSAFEIRKKFLNGDLSAEQVTSHFLKRIETFDQEIGAFLTVLDEKALDQARKLDEKRKKGLKLGKLAGIPIAFKDNIHIKDVITTCASKFLTNYKAPFNATVTSLVEEEDGILIGKTNLDEFAMGSSTENSALKKTRNPWNLSCVPGGSSGGSGAAVSARLCPIAFGSDTGGSIRLPAAFCGVTGFKPTYGRVSRYGLVAYGSSLDQIGPFAKEVKDIALMMEVIGKHCEKDSTSIPLGSEEIVSKLGTFPKDLKIGVPWHLIEKLSEEPKKAFLGALEVYKNLGAALVDIRLDLIDYSIAVYYILATAEASTNLARFDGIRYGLRSPRAKTLREVYDFSKEEGFGKEVKKRILLGTFVLSAGYQNAYYKKAQKVRTLIIEEFRRAFSSCSIIAMPVSPFAAFKSGEIKDPIQMYLEDLYTIPCNLAGLPAISIPSGFTQDGRPLGLQLMAAQKQDGLLLQAADAFQRATPYHQAIPDLYK